MTSAQIVDANRNDFHSEGNCISSTVSGDPVAQPSAPVFQIGEYSQSTRPIAVTQKEESCHAFRLPPAIHRLPLDIILEIFYQCMPSGLFLSVQSRQAPLLLGHINTTLRSICLSTPKLWSSLELYAGSSLHHTKHELNQDEISRAEFLLGIWASRSRGYPLSLSIHDHLFRSPSILETFLSASHRTRHLRLVIPNNLPSLISQLSVNTPLTFPALETCQLVTDFDDIDESHSFTLSTILKSSPIQRFVWYNSQDIKYFDISPNWATLTYLRMNIGVPSHLCLDILQLAPEMVHVSLYLNDKPFAERSEDFAHLTLPRLRSLLIRVSGSESDAFFSSLTLPSLRMIVFNGRVNSGVSLRSLIRRSQCPVESLNLYNISFPESEVLGCLELLQNSLKEFTLQQYKFPNHLPTVTDTFLDQLTIKDNRCLCPKLEVVALYDCIACSKGKLAEMAQSRLRAQEVPSTNSAHIASLKVIEMYEWEKDILLLRQLRSQGLVMKVYAGCGTPFGMGAEESALLQKYQREGLALREYDLFAGFFGTLEDMEMLTITL